MFSLNSDAIFAEMGRYIFQEALETEIMLKMVAKYYYYKHVNGGKTGSVLVLVSYILLALTCYWFYFALFKINKTFCHWNKFVFL